jgi:DNA invertase Pin-like site-specific DNA recombinase
MSERQMLEDVMRPGSDIAAIVVHHTSRFARNATLARVVKQQLRKKGVKVISVCQDLNEDPMGQLIEGIFECIDQYESEVNGLRTSAALREATTCTTRSSGSRSTRIESRSSRGRSSGLCREYQKKTRRWRRRVILPHTWASSSAFDPPHQLVRAPGAQASTSRST